MAGRLQMTRISIFVRINSNKLFETIRTIRPKSNKFEKNLVQKWPNERENRKWHVEILFSGAWRSDVSSRRLVDTMLIRIRVVDETSTKNFDDFSLYEQIFPYLCRRVMLKSSLPGASRAHFYAIFHEKFVKNRTFLALFREFLGKNCSYKYEQF